jgi:hypothetical protein
MSKKEEIVTYGVAKGSIIIDGEEVFVPLKQGEDEIFERAFGHLMPKVNKEAV